MPAGGESIIHALRELASLANGIEQGHIAELSDRLTSARLRVLVVGETKRGKSTLVNALIGQPVLPAGLIPLTAVPTTLRYGDRPRAEVVFIDGREEEHALDELATLVTEPGNPGNSRGIARVTVFVDAPLLAQGLELVDTPGTGSVFVGGTEAAYEAMEAMDAAVLVLSPDPPVSEIERELLGKIARRSVKTFAVLNKADRLDERGLGEVIGFTQRVLSETSSGGACGARPGRVHAVSAQAALAGGDRGFAEFASDFTAYLTSRGLADLKGSVAAQARRITLSLLDEVALTRHAAELLADETAQRVDEFGSRLAEVTVSSRDAVTMVGGVSARLLFALNDSADEEISRLSHDLARQVGALPDGSVADLWDCASELLATQTRTGVAHWRRQWQEEVQRELAGLDAQLAAELRSELEVMRDSAAQLLSLNLAVPELGQELTDGRLFITPHEDKRAGTAGSTLAARPPRVMSRRRARQQLRREAAAVVDQQMSEARSGLQSWLDRLTRTLTATARQGFADGTSRLQDALAAAAELRESSAAEAQRKKEELASREAALSRVLALLDQVADSSSP